jgi:photosystem II stability/assembly factor-like uncharacterized protein
MIKLARILLMLVAMPLLMSCTLPGAAISAAPARSPSKGALSRADREEFDPNTVAFWNEQHGLLGASVCRRRCSGVLATTDDGGATWHQTRRTIGGVIDVSVVGQSLGWATVCLHDKRGCPTARLLRTSDGGRTWDVVGTRRISSTSFSGDQVGWGVQGPSTVEFSGNPIRRTRTAGVSWSKGSSPCPEGAPVLQSVSAVTRQTAMAFCFGEGGPGEEPKAVVLTRDGGQSWRPVAEAGIDASAVGPHGLSTLGFPSGIAMLSDGTAWAWELQSRNIYMTDGPAAHWDAVSLPGSVSDVFSADPLTPRYGYVLATTISRYVLYRTSDAGNAWTKVIVFQQYDPF